MSVCSSATMPPTIVHIPAPSPPPPAPLLANLLSHLLRLLQILGVSRSADEAEIKKAYRKAALKYHPDRQSSKTEEEKEQAGKVFRDIGEAYEVLSDPQKKQRYDSGVDLEDIDNPHAGHGGRHG